MRIPIVNEQDEIIGYKDRSDRNEADIIRTTNVWITDDTGEFILLQKRSLKKKNSPGVWCPAVSGTVEENESYEENAYKELEEEIGIKDVRLVEGKKYFYGTQKFNQMYKLFLPVETKFVLQESEVDQVKWFSVDELKEDYKNNPDNFVKFIGVVLEDLYN